MTCVLTLALDAASQARFEALRQRWFPPERNQISAHLTLFHTLPEEPWVIDVLATTAAGLSSFSLGTPAPKSIGRGVAFFFDSTDARALQRQLRDAFADVLTAQDKQGFRPHVVVQNKASGDAAQVCLAAMQGVHLPQPITATGLVLWRYLNGPWEHLQTFHFVEQETSLL